LRLAAELARYQATRHDLDAWARGLDIQVVIADMPPRGGACPSRSFWTVASYYDVIDDDLAVQPEFPYELRGKLSTVPAFSGISKATRL